MTSRARLTKALANAKEMTIPKRANLILFSDLHRAGGGGADHFARNQEIYLAALRYYDARDFYYIELGDGDDLWEEADYNNIVREYEAVFLQLRKFYEAGRLLMLSGNHDIVKRNPVWVEQNMQSYKLQEGGSAKRLFRGIETHEAMILSILHTDIALLLLHGHQADFLNTRLSFLARFLVQHLWQPLALLGLRNPFDAVSKPKHPHRVEKRLTRFAEEVEMTIVAGHTHRPYFSQEDEGRYFNSGSGVHTRYITGLEIREGKIAQVKWERAVKPDGTLYIKRKQMTKARVL